MKVAEFKEYKVRQKIIILAFVSVFFVVALLLMFNAGDNNTKTVRVAGAAANPARIELSGNVVPFYVPTVFGLRGPIQFDNNHYSRGFYISDNEQIITDWRVENGEFIYEYKISYNDVRFTGMLQRNGSTFDIVNYGFFGEHIVPYGTRLNQVGGIGFQYWYHDSNLRSRANLGQIVVRDEIILHGRDNPDFVFRPWMGAIAVVGGIVVLIFLLGFIKKIFMPRRRRS